MDLKRKWQLTHQSICLIEHYKGGELISTGSGFKAINNTIITNNHVFACREADNTSITFFESNGFRVKQKKTFNRVDYRHLLIAGDPVDGWDFAILNGEDFNTIPGLPLIKEGVEQSIGSEIFFLGFPLNSNSLTIHAGNISAKYTHESGVKYLQIDGSINAGNSGGPLLDFNSDSVIGIVTRKETGLTQKFAQLRESFKDNIAQLEAVQTRLEVDGVDPMNAIKITQAQLNLLSDEINRSTNVGIGFAFELDLLRTRLED